MNAVTIRDALWDTIRLDPVAMRIVDSSVFQRLRYIKQLGHAHLVYPGATHTRFDHAIGVYHLARRAIAVLREQDALDHVDPVDCALVPYAALLHDIGHYPFSHALEELQSDLIPGHHEALTGHFFSDPEVTGALRSISHDAAARIETLIRGQSTNPLQGLVSGSLDLDKIDYLKRDARFCGVPYGEVDVDRLLHGLLLLRDPLTWRLEIGVHEKGVAALESLLFAKYQMFRNVYWHHAVRAATVLYKRMVNDALSQRLLQSTELIGLTDEAVLFLIEMRAGRAAGAESVMRTANELRARRLPKRAAEVAAAELPDISIEWLETDSPVKREVERALARELGMNRDDVFLDFPEKSAMFSLDILMKTRSGEVVRLGPGGRTGLIGLPAVANELYRSARVLRLFTRGERRNVSTAALARLAHMSSSDVTARVEARAPLLA